MWKIAFWKVGLDQIKIFPEVGIWQEKLWVSKREKNKKNKKMKQYIDLVRKSVEKVPLWHWFSTLMFHVDSKLRFDDDKMRLKCVSKL
jgi:hypothetical protein